MWKIKKRRVCNDFSSFSCLPDELVLLILNKLIDLKTLCLCKLVSTRFNLIVHQVDTISFVALPVDNPGLHEQKFHLAIDCLMDAVMRFRMLMGCVIDFPLLEKVVITQSGKRGSVSISGRNIVEMRKWLCSPTDSLEQKLSDSMDLPSRFCQCYVPLLKLPVSGYLMKGVTLIMATRKDLLDGDDNFMNIDLDDFEDKEEAAYGEAVMEMLKKLRGQI